MISRSFWQNTKAVRMKPDGTNYSIGSGSATNTSNSLDALGAVGVAFIALAGAITTSIAWVVNGSNDNSTFVAVTGGSVTQLTANAHLLELVSIYKPKYRYYQVVATTTTGTIDGLVALVYNEEYLPLAAQDASVDALSPITLTNA